MPDHPNTSRSDKRLALLLAMLVAVMPFSIDAYLPAIPAMAAGLHADIHKVEQSLSVFLFGVALGQLFGGSWSDIKGRRPMALIGLTVYLLATLALMMVQNVNQLLWLRLLQAFGGGMATVVVAAVVRDQYEGKQAAQMFALIGIIMMAAPLLAPLIGAVLQKLAGWRAIFAFLAAYALLLLGLIYQAAPRNRPTAPPKGRIWAGIVARYHRVLSTREALGFLFVQAFSFSSMFVFLNESPFVYMKLYGLSEHAYAWVFGLNIVTMAVFNRITAWRLRHNESSTILLYGLALQFGCNATMLLLALFGQPPLALLVALVMLSVGSQGLMVANTQACFMTYFKTEGGSANAVLGTLQFVIAASVGFVTTWLHNGTVLIMPLMMLLCSLTGAGLLWLCSRQVWLGQSEHGL